MSSDRQLPHSQLFTMRLWAEDLGGGKTEWRGRVQHVTSEEAHYFRDWDTLVKLLVMLLDQNEAAQRPIRTTHAPATEGE